MKDFTRKTFIYLMSLINLRVEKLTDKNLIISLIQKLHPFSTDKNLIRFGPTGDGGYLIPDDIDGLEACFSPGVGELSGFEADCIRNGMKVFLADKSVNSPGEENKQFNFIRKFIGPITNKDFITMDDWVNSSLENDNSDLLLQMDIEGFEYSTIINMSSPLLKRFRIIIIEFHSLNKLWGNEFYNMASQTFEKILQNHTCVHIHPNNYRDSIKIKGIEIPKLAEFTFVRNDRINKKFYQTKFPHPLDFDNVETKKTMTLPKVWYGINKEKIKR
jgi:Methyltransferase FkbM domain